MKHIKYLLVFTSLIYGCQPSITEKNTPDKPSIKEIATPSEEGGEPNLFTSETDRVYLSWIEYANDTTDVLMFSEFKDQNWMPAQTIATGHDWFVNWADFPSLVAYTDNGQSFAAHWLQKSAEGTYDYDVKIAQSFDAGKTWTPAFIPHRDSISAEHGFVSMLPLSKDNIFATWLDGRNTKSEKQETSGGHHGAMTLRSAIFDKAGNLFEEVELDNRICDCCQTSAALTDKGPIVAYRDRSKDEIRDIAVVRQVDGKWTNPSLVFKDNWHITGCPVNGPSIAADKNFVAIAWFTMSNEKPEVKVAFSENSGQDFSQPIQVSNDNPLGRVDIILLNENTALVSWLEKTDNTAEIKSVKVNSKGKIGESFLVATTDGSRSSGFPIITRYNDQVLYAWTENKNGLSTVKSATLSLDN